MKTLSNTEAELKKKNVANKKRGYRQPVEFKATSGKILKTSRDRLRIKRISVMKTKVLVSLKENDRYFQFSM